MRRAHAPVVSVFGILFGILSGILCASGTFAAEGAPTADDYVGRWNIKMFENRDTFSSSWLKIESADSDAPGSGLTGAMVWKWGGVGKLGKVEVVDD